MRDLQRLEKLSSTAALGLWADDLVLALDRAKSGEARASDSELLRAAAGMLEQALEWTAHPLAPPRSARDLAATNTTLSALAALAQEQSGEEQQLLEGMAKTIRDAAEGRLTQDDMARLDSVIGLFELVGERQLVESNSVLMSRKDTEPWTAIETTLTSS